MCVFFFKGFFNFQSTSEGVVVVVMDRLFLFFCPVQELKKKSPAELQKAGKGSVR